MPFSPCGNDVIGYRTYQTLYNPITQSGLPSSRRLWRLFDKIYNPYKFFPSYTPVSFVGALVTEFALNIAMMDRTRVFRVQRLTRTVSTFTRKTYDYTYLHL